jgi:hypothetical protein
MRFATLASALALFATPALAAPHPADAAPADRGAPGGASDAGGGDTTTTDLRCMVVAAALVSSDDEQMRSLGRANLFYYLGRLQGRGDVGDMNNRLVDLAGRMNEDDIKTQAKACGAMFTAATQALQDMSNAFAQHFGSAAAPK